MTPRPVLSVHTKAGVVEVPLTGDDDFDAKLERIARGKGHAVTKDGVLQVVAPADPEQDMRAALKAGD